MEGLDSWRILLYLLPVGLGMAWIRFREAREGSTSFREMTPGQKAWVLLVALPPGASAALLGALPAEAERGYLQAGSAVRGSGQNLVAGVVREFTAALPAEWTAGAGRDVDELLALLTRCVASRGPEVAGVLVRTWPPPAVLEPEVPPAEPPPPEPGPLEGTLGSGGEVGEV